MTLKIGLTQNLKKYFKNYIDFSDHYWIRAFSKKNMDFLLVPNHEKISETLLRKINLLILSGGNDVISREKTSIIRNKVELNLIKKSIQKKIPILGICRGAQLLNLFFGGKITKINNHMDIRHKIFFEDKKIFNQEKLTVNSYHNYGIIKNNLSKHFKTLANDESENIEMFISEKNRIIGTMWHPEREKNLYYLFKLINYFKIK